MKVLLNDSITLTNTSYSNKNTHTSYKRGDIVDLPTITANDLINKYMAISISGPTTGKTRVRALKSFGYTHNGTPYKYYNSNGKFEEQDPSYPDDPSKVLKYDWRLNSNVTIYIRKGLVFDLPQEDYIKTEGTPSKRNMSLLNSNLVERYNMIITQ